jgi:hypothetical protein
MNETLPLIGAHGLDDVFAWRAQGAVTVREFLADAHALAARLPEGGWLLNVCEDRYHFAVGFAAGLLAGKVSLQPSSQSPETLQRLAADYPGVSWLGDRPGAVPDLPGLVFPDLAGASRPVVSEMPQVDAGRVVAILFTSGSTGLPQPHRKTWGKLVLNGRAEATALGLMQRPQSIVGTVPVQHSYGFESTFLIALHGGCQFAAGKPFYPQDIVAALEAVPRPRMLVTTPFHLSALRNCRCRRWTWCSRPPRRSAPISRAAPKNAAARRCTRSTAPPNPPRWPAGARWTARPGS